MSEKKLKTLQEGIAEVRKQYGTASVFMPKDDFRSNIESVSTGSFNLNDAIGVGGVPCGRLMMLSGIESSGKSLLALSIIKEAQKTGGIGYYIDAEYTFDPDWTQRLGVDIDRIMVSQTNDAKAVFELLLGKPAIQGKRQNAIPGIINNEKLIKAGLKVIVIDSIDALAPPMEMSSEVGKMNMALMARFLPPELRRLTPILSKTGISVIAIMQARQTPGQLYGDALTVSGGRALKHAASVWLDLGIVSQSAITIDGRKDGEKTGHKIRGKIRKNKVAPPFKKAEFTIYFQKGIDVRPEIPEQAIQVGVIVKESTKTYSYKSDLGDFKWNGMSNLLEALYTNKDLMLEIAKKVKEAKKEQELNRLDNTEFTELSEEDVMTQQGTVDESLEGFEDVDTEPADSPEVSKPQEEKKEIIQKSSDSSDKKVDPIKNKQGIEEMTLKQLKEEAKRIEVPNLWKYQSKQDLLNIIQKSQ